MINSSSTLIHCLPHRHCKAMTSGASLKKTTKHVIRTTIRPLSCAGYIVTWVSLYINEAADEVAKRALDLPVTERDIHYEHCI